MLLHHGLLVLFLIVHHPKALSQENTCITVHYLAEEKSYRMCSVTWKGQVPKVDMRSGEADILQP